MVEKISKDVKDSVKKQRTYTDAIRQKTTKTPQKQEPEYLKKEKSIRFCIRDGFFTSIKNGVTESYIMPYAIALNASHGMLAALASVPQLVGSFFQLFSQESLKYFKTRSRLIVWTAVLQAIMWLPLIFIPFFAKDAIWLIILFATLETTFSAFQGPIYNSMLGDIISEDKRGEFFGKRNRIVNLMNFVFAMIAGLILNYFKGLDKSSAYYIFFGFGILFFIAFISRTIAAYYKAKIYDPEFKPARINTNFFQFMGNMTKNNYGIFVFYVFLFKLATAISAPFFALYILKDLGMGYIQFTIIMGISIVASFLSMTLWGKLIDKYGSKFVLTLSGYLVSLSPFLMILAIYIKDPTGVFIFLLVEEAFSGLSWAAFNLSASSFLFDATSKVERIKYISYYNFLVGIGIFLGAVLGGVLIEIFPIWIVSATPFVLLLSGMARLASTIVMIKKVREARMVEIDFAGRGFFHNVISVTPHFGSNIEIISPYEGFEYQKFHSILPTKKKRPPKDPVQDKERELYYKKSLELYRESAIKTLAGKKDIQKDDSDKIQDNIESQKDKIKNITEEIRKKNIK